jgi:putative oxidoreductase
MTLSLALLITRIAVGGLLIAHGSQKLFGWFGGRGFNASINMLQSKGFKPAQLWALLGAGGEFGGGVLVVLGFLTPLGTVAIIAAMMMAITKFHRGDKLIGPGGYEYPLLLLLISLAIGLAGPGNISLDALLHINPPVALVFLPLLIIAIIIDIIGLVISNHQAPAEQRA